MPIIIDQARLTFFKEQFEKRFSNGTELSLAFKSAVADERKMKVDLIDEVAKILESETDASHIGEQFYEAVKKTFHSIHSSSIARVKDLQSADKGNYKVFCELIGDVLISEESESELYSTAYSKIQDFHYKKIENAPARSAMIHLLFAALSSKPGSTTIVGMVDFFGDVTDFFLGRKLLTYKDENVEDSFNQLNGIVARLFDEMSDVWGWKPQDIIDVQCALWLEFKVDNLESYKNYSSS